MKNVVNVPSVGILSITAAVRCALQWHYAKEDAWECGRYAEHNRLVLHLRYLGREINRVRWDRSKRLSPSDRSALRHYDQVICSVRDPRLIEWEILPFPKSQPR